jgi:hypothetical protein
MVGWFGGVRFLRLLLQFGILTDRLVGVMVVMDISAIGVILKW